MPGEDAVRLIDTHCHLTDSRLARQVPEVLARADSAGVAAVICAASSVADSIAAAELARRNETVCWMAGVHPHEANAATPGYLDQIEELARADKNVAVGEIGLDYHYDFCPRELQRRLFAEQLELAGRLGKPVAIHTREASDDTLAILAEARLPGESIVFHSFTGGVPEARRAVELGAYVSFSGIATFNSAGETRAAAALIAEDRILIETDAPYLSPEPVRRMKVNEPANVAHVARCLAAVRKARCEEFAELVTANAIRLFALDMSA